MSPPHRELELKAVAADPDRVRRRLHAAGAQPCFRGRMSDVRYDRAGELMARDEVLRLRTCRGSDGTVSAQVTWKGRTQRSPEGYKLREEIDVPVGGDPRALLAALGYEPVHRIEREVEVWQLAGATARLERYPRMDVLVEVEGEPAAIERVAVATGIPRSDFTAEPLAEFVRRFEARTGRQAELAVAAPAGSGR
jgi:adenylate cyclase class IV